MAKLTQRKDGRYCAWYKGKQFYGYTEKEAKKKRDDYAYEMMHGIEQIKQITVEEYADEWLPVAKANVSKRCYVDYEKQLEQLVSVCGGKLMSAVTPDDIKKVWVHYVGYSESTIHRARMIYKSLFESGIESGHCRFNPVKKETAKPHKGTKGTHRTITQEERYLIEHVNTVSNLLL